MNNCYSVHIKAENFRIANETCAEQASKLLTANKVNFFNLQKYQRNCAFTNYRK